MIKAIAERRCRAAVLNAAANSPGVRLPATQSGKVTAGQQAKRCRNVAKTSLSARTSAAAGHLNNAKTGQSQNPYTYMY
eukprot:gene16797-biopygen18823